MNVRTGLLADNSVPERIVVVRALPGLGDMLCIVPALRALRATWPGAHITLVGLDSAESFVERFNHYVDELVVVPGFPGLAQPYTVSRLPDFFALAQQRQYDLALQMHGSGVVSNPFTVMLGAQVTAGCYLPGEYCPDDEYFLPLPTEEPEVRRWLQLLEFLGIPSQGEALEFPIGETDIEAFESLTAVDSLQSGHYLCLHPGARSPERRWPADRFAAVADAFVARGFDVVLTGTAEETPITQAVARAMKTKPIDLAGHTTLGALAVLLRDARLCICNDTGVSHLADALDVPSVVTFTSSDPKRWAPIDRERHRVVTGRPCYAAKTGAELRSRHSDRKSSTSSSGNGLVRNISTSAVLREAEQLLQQKWDAETRSIARSLYPVSPKSPNNFKRIREDTRAREIIDTAFEEATATFHLSHKKLQAPITEAAEVIYSCFTHGGKVLICGNGGSAADAQHLAAELVGRFKSVDRSALPALALTADSAVLTAWSNDVGYDHVFARQVEAFGRPGDVLVGISTSGRSANVTAAFKAARRRQMNRIGLLGGDGGDTLPLADVGIVVPTSDSQRVQEVQMLILHVLCELVEYKLQRRQSALPAGTVPVDSKGNGTTQGNTGGRTQHQITGAT